jgi:diguanylate cyclase (GGDEF)-like protein
MEKLVVCLANIAGFYKNLKPLSKERIYITLIFSSLFYCFQKYDAFEALMGFSRKHEQFEVDEFFLLLMSLSLVLIFINLRKNRYLQNEISRRIDVENKIKKLAFYDGLTGLANRELCLEHLKQRLGQADRSKNKAAVLFIDLDNFKDVNDSYGHAYGDELLIQFSKRIASELREDSSLSRISGDEFIILLGAIDDPASIGILAERLLSVLSLPFSLHGHDAFIGMSIGIAVYPEDETTAKGLIKHADIAMYHAKSEGKNTYRFFSEQLDQQAKDKFSVRTHLKKALENGELSLVYQPIINTASQKLIGAEALLRWNNPELGDIPPNVFIPIAEENGLISKIGDWVLLEACQQNKQWQQQGYDPIVMSVNMSARQLAYDKYISSVVDSLKHSQLESRYLELELTETTIMKDVNMAIERLHLLKKLGIKLALDDFGTGYSSMGYINQLKLNRLKIDRSFINKISDNAENSITLNAIISLAKNLGLEITAEGIETAEQLDFIASTACDSVQGFFYSKPVSADKFEIFLKDPQFKNSEFPILLTLSTSASA